MSVIFGIKENNRIIIAGDKRGSSIDGKTLSDDLDKVLMINDHLAFSSAGNAAIEKAISIDLNKATNKDCLDCFAKNYKLHNSEFVEKTIKEIANISNLVSPTGNKWIYNIATEKGMLFSF